PMRRPLWLLFAAAGLVLAAGCANVANLLLARTSGRVREMVTRAALGAAPSRLTRQLLAESLLLSLAGGAGGALVARSSRTLVLATGSPKIPREAEVALDWRAFVFLLAACAVTSVLFGLAPAIAASRLDARMVTSPGGRATPGSGVGRLRDFLVVL